MSDEDTYVGRQQDPHADSCSNPGRDDHFTCPGCYDDVPSSGGEIVECSGCGAWLRTEIEQQPVATARMIRRDDTDDIEDPALREAMGLAAA